MKFMKLLNSEYPSCYEKEEEDDNQSKIREGALKITLDVLRKMKQTDLANTLQTSKSHFYLRCPYFTLNYTMLSKCFEKYMVKNEIFCLNSQNPNCKGTL